VIMATKWTVSEVLEDGDPRSAYAIKDADGNLLAVADQEKDAKLMALAPDLVETLALYMEQYPEVSSMTTVGVHAKALLRQAGLK